jgi:opacity protein-like surface antigen
MSISGGGLGILTLAVNGKMPVLPLPVITPYLTGGIGLAWVNRDEVTTSITGFPGNKFPSSSQSGKTSVDVGAGVDIKIGIALFFEVKYAWIFTDVSNSTYVPVTVGVTF